MQPDELASRIVGRMRANLLDTREKRLTESAHQVEGQMNSNLIDSRPPFNQRRLSLTTQCDPGQWKGASKFPTIASGTPVEVPPC